jgi:hypothetical protein
MFQNKLMPVSGKNSRQKTMIAPISQTTVCTIRQIAIDRKDNLIPDLKGTFSIGLADEFIGYLAIVLKG